MEKPLIDVQNLTKQFVTRRSFRPVLKINAIDDVSFSIMTGETFGLVGESGCGKSTLGRTIMRLYDATSGSIKFENMEITNLKGDSLKKIRRNMQMVFQDPYSSLNPSMRVFDIVAEPLILKTERVEKDDVRDTVARMLEKVGLTADDMKKYPYQFSGGQRQRISIARALVVRPRFVFCDEPISALDVSIQAQVVNLLQDLQEDFGLTYLFVAHDLSMVRHISHRIAVMYMGKIVEIAGAKAIYQNPLHPYTKTLLESVPIPDPKRARLAKREVIFERDSQVPAAHSGCPFFPRCQQARPECRTTEPVLQDAGGGHLSACMG
jgi:oligopeptide/dipeptide ABC transporter ATP-binding protein